jgi:tetratricopeptide (TPR) repeat protein
MKATVSIVIFLLVAFFAFGQNETLISPAQIGEVKVTPPEFTGNLITNPTNELSLINSYLAKNVKYPENDFYSGPQGTEVIQFTITSEGKVTDFHVINSVSWYIDREVISVLKATNGMWKPGYNNNNPVDMTKEISMIFCNSGNSENVGELFTNLATTSYNKGIVALYEKQNVNKALKFFSNGINYLPNDKCLLLLRGTCLYELGDKEGAIQDWKRMANLGETIDMSEYTELIKGMKGYDELMAVLKK